MSFSFKELASLLCTNVQFLNPPALQEEEEKEEENEEQEGQRKSKRKTGGAEVITDSFIF